MDYWNNKIENAVVAVRVSSAKQGLQGDSPEAQKEQIEHFAKSHNITIKKVFVFIESASKEHQPVQEAIDYCKDPKNDIQLFIIKSIDRFTRGGSYSYDHLKMQLTKYGVRLVDIYGIISNQQVNTLGHLGVEFKWSKYSPTQKTELLEAERAKDEIRDILTRMIGAEIRYTRLGYRCSVAPFGYTNEKAETQHGKRVVLKAHPEESKWIIKMFELRLRGTLSDIQIIQELNGLGFTTRMYYRRNPKDRTQIVGTKGGGMISLKQFIRYIEDPIYAGIAVHKWTDNKPVKGQFPGIVTKETFNQANKGRIAIIESNGEIKIEKDLPPTWRLKKTVQNPDFPYRRYVHCPECDNPLFGSASRGKLGKYYPAYHCNKRGHYFRVPNKDFNKTIANFVKNLKITPDYIEKLKERTIQEWERRMMETKKDTIVIAEKIAELQKEQFSLAEKIKILSSEYALKSVETDIMALDEKIKELEKQREVKDSDYINMELILDKVGNFLEHLDDLLLAGSNPLKNAAYFAVLFQKAPTYQELVSGTPQLEPCIKLKGEYESAYYLNVDD